MKHPIVYTTAPITGVCATLQWDEASCTVSCQVTYSPLAPPREPQIRLSGLLDARFGIGAPAYVLTAGTLSVLLDQHHRLTGLDFYTNPQRWTVGMTELSAAADATPHIDTEFDEHGHAEDMGTPVVFYEPRQGTLYLSWGAACHWYAIAPALAFGVADDNRLAQIRLHGLTLAPRRGNPACGELTIRR